jgi:hypothetical protein
MNKKNILRENKNPVILIVVLFLFTLLIYNTGCENNNVTGPYGFNPGKDGFAVYSTNHFNFHYTSIDINNITNMGTYLENNFERVTNDLKYKNISTVDIWLYAYMSDFHAAINWPNAPDWVCGVTPSKNLIRVISPNSSQLGNRTYEYMLGILVHEFTHTVCMNMNTSSQVPRWMVEGVAVYESNRFTNPATLSYMKAGTPPTLKEMEDRNDTKAYEVGYTLIEYIVNTWGMDSVIELYKSNGNIMVVLKITSSEFESGWYKYVQNKYF